MEVSIEAPELAGEENGAPASLNSLFPRKIVFHPARKPYNGFSSKPASDFRIETLNPGADQHRLALSESEHAGGSRKRDASDLFDGGLDPELTLTTTFRKIGAGLENLGNTCFLNSVLQCLTYTEPLVAYLQSGKHQNTCHVVGFCALCAIQKHVSRALQATGRILAPKDLVSNLRCISRNFRNARQEDAHEYMVNLLESMHKCCLPSGVQSESSSAYDKSLVHKIFGGRLRSRVKCRECLHASDKYDPFLDLSLEIIKADSLKRALQNFTAPEILDGGEKQYQCQNCKKKVQASKQLTIDKAPYVLTIHLKRFRAYDPGQKIDKKVQFAPNLDMKPFVSGSYEGQLKYTLYGVLVHCGWSTRSGHYYCFVRTSSGMWHSLDDNRVFQVNERTVLEQKAYMLFYVRDRETIPSRQHTGGGMKNTINPNVSSIMSSVFKHSGYVDGKLRGSENVVLRVQMDAIDSGVAKFKHQQAELLVQDKGQLADVSVTAKGSFLGQPSGSSCDGNDSNIEEKAVDIGFSACKGVGDLGAGKVIRGTVVGNTEVLVIDSALEKDSEKINVALIGDSSGTQSGHFNDHTVGNVQGQLQCASHANGASEKAIVLRSLSDPSLKRSQIATGVYGSPGCSLKGPSDCGEMKAVEFVESTVSGGGCGLEENRTPDSIRRRIKRPKNRSKLMHIWLKPFKAALGLRLKKKHRKRKANAKNVKVISKEQLIVKDYAPTDLAASTSETTSASSLVTANHRKRNTVNDVMKNVQQTFGFTKPSFDRELSQRICQNGSVLADESVRTHGLKSKSNEQDERGTNSQNSMMHLLTQGLKETAVAQWDDIGFNFPTEEPNNSEANIGYVLDEWEEEYDRGRRKKLRQSKHSFGGPNLFQEVAMKKMRQKKVKINHSMTGNHPLRI